MLSVCISGFLVLSLTASILFWAAFVAATRTDRELEVTGDFLMIDFAQDMSPVVGLIPSRGD